jgi:hypothetical protein
MNKSKLAAIITIVLILPSCVKRLPEKKFHKFTDEIILPNELFQSKLLVHFIDSIPLNAQIGSSSWDNSGLISEFEILSHYSPEKTKENIDPSDRKLNKVYNEYVPILNEQLTTEIAQCKVKCVPFRKADFLKNTSKLYPANEYTFVLVRSIRYIAGLRHFQFLYTLFNRNTYEVFNISYKYTSGLLIPSVYHDRMIFRKINFEYLKRFPE